MNTENPEHLPPRLGIKALMWWVTLVVAVMVFPLIAGGIALALSKNSFIQIVVFMLTCWACTWLGMWLMKKSQDNR